MSVAEMSLYEDNGLASTHDFDAGDWAALWNQQNQEEFLAQIRSAQRASSITDGQMAERLGLGIDEIPKLLSGAVDLTMTELRLILIALEAVVDYVVTSVSEHHAETSSKLVEFLAQRSEVFRSPDIEVEAVDIVGIVKRNRRARQGQHS